MVTKKREVREDGSSDRLGVSTQRPVVNDLRTVFGGIPVDLMVARLYPWLETFFRGTVGEEVDRALSRNPSVMSVPRSVALSGGCNLELRFMNEVPRELYSRNPIMTDGGAPLGVALVDRAANETVNSGALSSSKVEIIVISNEFGSDDERQDWTAEDFNRSVVRERDGKRPLLTGEINMRLMGGVGTIGSVAFTDNSCWTRSKKFRLGVRVVPRTSTEIRVREAVSNPFTVKENRGERHKKHYPPSPQDEVWRLEKIRKDGPLHDRLRSHGITTVIDFLRHYEVDPPALKSILCKCTRTWNAIVNHANTCVVDDGKFFSCCFASEDVVLVFNSVYRVVGAVFSNLGCLPLESLTSHQKAIVERLKMEAHRKRSEWMPVNEAATEYCAPNLPQNEATHFYPGEEGVTVAPVSASASYNYEAVATAGGFVADGDHPSVRRRISDGYISRGDEHRHGMNSNRSSLTSLDTF